MRPSYKAFRNFEIGSGCTSLADGFDRTWYQVTQDAAFVAIPGARKLTNVVRRESNPRFHELISCFFARTGVPVVINTSFNDSEPIVCTPADAIVTFRKAGIDALFMDDVYLMAQT